MTTELPAAVRRFVEATNAGDSDAFVDVFTDDATLDDWGRTFHGHDGIRSWNQTDNIGVHSHFEVVGVEVGADADTFTVTLAVSGGGYNGTGPMEFTVRDDRISALRIVPT